MSAFPQKNKPIPVKEDFYRDKQWDVQQVLKDSVVIKYISAGHHEQVLTISRLSSISITLTELAVAQHVSVSEKLQTHLKKWVVLYADNYYTDMVRCSHWSYPGKYQRPVVHKFFFLYQ